MVIILLVAVSILVILLAVWSTSSTSAFSTSSSRRCLVWLGLFVFPGVWFTLDYCVSRDFIDVQCVTQREVVVVDSANLDIVVFRE